ncbi:hypothetical protein [Planktothrix pseudagardhii]|uniref:Uncharacterized protein n=1 Tax=Planktothrix pseudagardhii TaxID=132604 RepID=A0A9W4G982_9CYAN|nr:hypothetical protein [Planktothrix pseudagardhii]CAD5966737.1 hypothetical protein NO713_03553 [Planktothrix pseudagardhii]
MESMIKLSALNTSLIEVRLIEGRDQAYITVNEHYFSWVTGTKINISSALQEGVNLLNLMIKTYPLIERIRRGLFNQDWCGRFELYIDGKLRGTYNQSGGVILGSREYTVAQIELNIDIDHSKNNPDQPDKELLKIISRLENIPGMTSANSKDVQYSTPYILLKKKFKINIWKNLAGVDHVFVLDSSGNCCFAGYVGWIHAQKFYQTLQQIRNDYSNI